MRVLEVSGLTIVRDGRVIVEDIHLAVDRGSIHFIAGPNGGGKSSVLEAILGQTTFTGGVRFEFARPEMRGRIGYVPQSFPVDPTLPVSVGEFLALSRQRLPVCFGVRPAVKARIGELLERVGLAGVVGRRLGALSGGELRRVLLAQALDPRPELLILDEPASGLDTASVTRLEEILRALRDEGSAVLMVSHDREQALRLANELTWIDRRVLGAGAPELTALNPPGAR